MKWAAALKLGRVSNLPTVWTNVLAGAVLANPDFDGLRVVLAAAAVSLLYIAGMFLNDAFDVEWDREHQADRPIVKGEASLQEVVRIAVALLVAGVALVLLAAGGRHWPLAAVGVLALIGLVLLYDWKHKQWSFSPWIMGGCRLTVYLTAAAVAAGAWNGPVLAGGLCLLVYIAGITYSARAEHLNTLNNYWPVALLLAPPAFVLYLGFDNVLAWAAVAVLLVWLGRAARRLLPGPRRQVPRAVGALLAGIALVDTAILLALRQPLPALLAAGAFGLCLLAQRKIAPT